MSDTGFKEDPMKSTTDVTFWRELKASRPMLTKQQYRTIKGQAVKGNVHEARRGLQRIQRRQHR